MLAAVAGQTEVGEYPGMPMIFMRKEWMFGLQLFGLFFLHFVSDFGLLLYEESVWAGRSGVVLTLGYINLFLIHYAFEYGVVGQSPNGGDRGTVELCIRGRAAVPEAVMVRAYRNRRPNGRTKGIFSTSVGRGVTLVILAGKHVATSKEAVKESGREEDSGRTRISHVITAASMDASTSGTKAWRPWA